MVSYHNTMMYPKSHTSNLAAYGPYHHWYGNYAPSHHASNAQYLSAAAGAAAAAAGNVNGDIDNSGGYFNPHHHHVFHQASPDWTAHDNYGPSQTHSPIISPPSAGTPIPHHQHTANHQSSNALAELGATARGDYNHHGHHNHHSNGLDGGGVGGGGMGDDNMGHTPPSPPITVNSNCSEMSSPGIVNNNGNGAGLNGTGDDTNTHLSAMSTRPPQSKSPYEWMKKPSYQSQPQPGLSYELNLNEIFI